ncbi:MAG: TetR/AcrR family transcriptional regulator [Actinomycetota bacterium]|nr:TetR/AcrR family transcriptional regulator [Actinomycetota bacterium]
MPEQVKPRRPYRSERRREQAEETRERVLEAAATLFRERGFGSATIAAIAAEAGVSPETVYGGFRNKRTLLGELIRAAVRGGDASPVPQQAGPRAVAAATDQREQLRLFAADISLRLERVGPLVEVLSTAARSEPELAALLARVHDERLANLRTFVDALSAHGPLRLEPDAALETVWALASPDLHQLLTRTRGWSRERYCDWLAGSLDRLLL